MGNRVSRDEHLNTGELVGKPLCMSRLQLPAYRASSAVEAPVEATIGIPLEKHSFLVLLPHGNLSAMNVMSV